MKKIFSCFIAMFSFILPLSALTAASGNDIFSYIPYNSASWDSKTTSESAGVVTVIDQAVMFKGKKMRMEGVFTDSGSGTKVKQVMIMTNKVMYIINEEEKTGSKLSMNSAANPEKYREEAAKYRKTAKRIGAETISGTACDIYTFTHEPDGQDGEKMTVIEWMTKDGFVVKSVSELNDSKITTLVSNLKKNAVLDDSLFKPSADIKIIDMDNMMKGISTAQADDKSGAVKATPTAPVKTAAGVEETPKGRLGQ
jgi:outer membrane lipoprotein-sorting protein